jgi:hypothetical protein
MEQAMLWDNPDTAFTTGFIRGMHRSLARTFIGAYEVITFPFPSYASVLAADRHHGWEVRTDRTHGASAPVHRSSDRRRDFFFGSSLGRPCEHDDCLALSRRSSLLEMPELRAAKGPPPGGASGSPVARVLRDPGDGFDAARSLLEGEGVRE